jgi:hypothetical protein
VRPHLIGDLHTTVQMRDRRHSRSSFLTLNWFGRKSSQFNNY